jgi:hypothetical protein
MNTFLHKINMIIPKIDYRHNITLFKKNNFIIMNVTKNIASIYQTLNISAIGLVWFGLVWYISIVSLGQPYPTTLFPGWPNGHPGVGRSQGEYIMKGAT